MYVNTFHSLFRILQRRTSHFNTRVRHLLGHGQSPLHFWWPLLHLHGQLHLHHDQELPCWSEPPSLWSGDQECGQHTGPLSDDSHCQRLRDQHWYGSFWVWDCPGESVNTVKVFNPFLCWHCVNAEKMWLLQTDYIYLQEFFIEIIENILNFMWYGMQRLNAFIHLIAVC